MRKPSGAMRRLTGALLRVIGRVLMLMVLGCVIAAITILMILPRATDGAALTVLTGSMTPQIPVGSVVMIRPVDPATLQVGDIATYQKKPGVESYITHRVVSIDTSTSPASFTFKGDANRGEDVDPVPATAIRGEVWFHVPYLGAVRDALNGKAGLSLLAMLVLGGYAVSQVWSALTDRRKRPDHTSEAERSATVLFDRPLIVVDLPIETGEPSAVCQALSGVLLARGEDTFTVLMAPEPDRIESTLVELRLLEPPSLSLYTDHSATLLLSRDHDSSPQPRGHRRASHASA